VPTGHPNPDPRTGKTGQPPPSALLEGLLVVVFGVVLALVANSISPRGLALRRNYFPATQTPLLVTPTGSTSNVPGVNRSTSLEAELRQQGLGLADSKLVAQLVRDPRYEQGLIVVVDARDDEHYQRGHIPGAYQLDYYRPEAYLPTVLTVCQTAEQIVVYCNGGDCEDSKRTAIFLRDAGIPANKLSVYEGGITEWTGNGMSVETGQRKSGSFLEKGKS
jgi:rhodanese-related sulfurtransferase